MTHPIFQNIAEGMMAAQRLQSPGLTPPQPSGCPSCAAAEAQCDRMAQRIRDLEAEVCDAALAGHMIGADRAQERIRELEAALAFRDADVAALNLEIKRLNDVAHEAKQAQAQAEAERDAALMRLAS